MRIQSSILVLLCLYFTSSIQCREIKTDSIPVQNVKCIKIITNIPIVIGGNNIRNSEDSLFVFYFENYIAYKLPYTHTEHHVTIDKSGNIIGERDIPRIKYSYFVYNKQNRYGLRYDSLNIAKGRIIMVDSFLLKYGLGSFNLSDNYRSTCSLMDSTRTEHELQTVFVRTAEANIDYCDTICLYYTDKMKGIPYSLSEKSDSLDEMRLYKIRYINKAGFNHQYAINIPKRETWIEMAIVQLQHPEEIGNLVNKFRSQEK